MLTTVLTLLLALCPILTGAQLIESERVAEYHKRGYEWPPKAVTPNTAGWNKFMQRRIRQIQAIQDTGDKYNAYMSMVAQAVFPNFTETGWGLTRAPEDLVKALKESLHNGMENARPESKAQGRTAIEASENATSWRPPSFIQQWSLNRRVLEELKPMHEEWAGIQLVGQQAYGLRIYHNESMLHMHVDRMRTHIISSIVHVDHDDDPDSEPWPILIEDYQGNLNEVNLESGDMLFYESSKCMHGRPRPFKGKWYSSIFVHYYPAENWDKDERERENHYAIPPSWIDYEPLPEDDPDLTDIIMAATSYTEPACEHWWCGLKDTVKWSGPAQAGKIITAGHEAVDESDSDQEL